MAILGASLGRLRALTALFVKVGVEAIPSDLATFIRTLIVAAVLAPAFAGMTNEGVTAAG